MSRIRTALVGVLAAGLMLMSVGVAHADTLQVDDLTVAGDFTVQVDEVANVLYYLHANNGDGGSQVNGCNASDNTPANVTINKPAAVTIVSPSNPFTLSGCDEANGKTVQFKSSTPGSYSISAVVVDSGSPDPKSYNESPANFTLRVVAPADTTSPVIDVPDDIVKDADGPSGAVVNFSASAVDAVDGPRPVTCIPPSGSTFPIGDTVVTCTASDTKGNTATASFKVTVTTPHVDEAPAINASDITKEATGPTTPVTFNATASDNEDGNLTPSITYSPSGPFAVGVHNVTASVIDSAGHTVSKTFKVTITDTTPPELPDLPDIGPIEATGPNGAVVNYGPATAHDLVSGNIPVTFVPVPGSVFALGNSTVLYKAADNAGNIASDTFAVEVVDTTPPEITVPNDITKEATGPHTPVSFTATAHDLVDGDVEVTYNDNGPFAVGDHTVVVTAKDSRDHEATKSFKVTITDTTAPSLTLPANITVNATGNSQAAVTFAVSATDLVDGGVPVSCDHDSGSSFPVGTTTVNCSATDAHGNKATGSFTVRVVYSWNGFFQPIDNGDVVNKAKAGQSIPVKFSLGGNQGLNIMAPQYPSFVQGTVPPADTTDTVEAYATSTPGLTYDATANQYTYVWKTDKAWAGKTGTLKVKLADGSLHTAMFNFTR